MNHRSSAAATILALAVTVALSACSAAGTAPSAATNPQAVATAKGEGKTLTLWVMDGDYSDQSLKAINDTFTQQTGAKVDVQVQAWDGITTKVTTALATSNPPDVLDLGNTQIASFAANGGLKDLTPYGADLRQGQTWLSGLVAPATVDGKLYAVPGFAGARAVIYNKTMWAKAGVDKAPTTFTELTDDLAKVKAANPGTDFSPLYLPGQNWYAGMQFIWDAGGDIAAEAGSKWTAGFGADAAQAGLADFKAFQNQFSTAASRTVDTTTPDQVQVFADGKASAIIATSGFIGRIQKANPNLTDSDLGTFPLPGKSGKAQPVMLGGSDWGIAARSANADLALQWTKIAAGPDIQSKWVVGHEGFIPNSLEGIKAAMASVGELKKGFFDAALSSKATPANANWAQLEANKDINNLFAAVASGSKSTKDAASAFDATATKALNAGQ
ncbi:sugar ABC transporter substrate-binding protein [Kitasatospora herbaricolor]|uniref:extracellular solute-binding protein n=1 Tax=Kitasatospora herbaricolor TaxID=68217 RepID=UPI00174E3DD7|nr:extracellular solute-binding protein [Kitasatospora herbaricolor]MDQ0312486.1 N,N'-diacetylchitobiose transport system substrate-binding protein [Kitasatospora herbaricolor]GGV48998.1 sugar ABC transporter substrate-binding protein [Kitasatospora herbaricolor]